MMEYTQQKYKDIYIEDDFKLYVYKTGNSTGHISMWHYCRVLDELDVIMLSEVQSNKCLNCGKLSIPDGLLALYRLYHDC